MSIKAVIFDYGQVISLPQDSSAIDRLARRAGAAREKFEPLLWSLRDEYDRGTITSKEYYRNILSKLDLTLDDAGIDELIAIDLDSWKNINGGTVSLMEDIKRAGYVLGILSNMPCDFLVWARLNIPVFALSDTSLFSCDVKLIKPEEAIYRKLLSMLGLEGAEVVFFDDKLENIRGAQAVGIQAFLWEGPETARRVLLEVEVRL
ncbi:MAG: HAD family phosphatase [Treponema sp.]|nr:HAD family phosphatase [Treponema sp.]